MSLEMPDALKWVAALVGGEWPEADEDKLWDLAQKHRDFRDDMNAAADQLETVLQQFRQGVTGATAEQFAAMLGKQIKNNRDLASAAESLAGQLDDYATNIEYAKYMIISMMALVAVEIPLLMYFTFGSGVAPLLAGVRMAIWAILRNVLIGAAVGAGVGAALSAILQQIQVDQGHRAKIDGSLVGIAAGSGAISGGITGGVFGGAGLSAAGRRIMSTLLGKMALGGIGGAAGMAASDAAFNMDGNIGLGFLAGAVGGAIAHIPSVISPKFNSKFDESSVNARIPKLVNPPKLDFPDWGAGAGKGDFKGGISPANDGPLTGGGSRSPGGGSGASTNDSSAFGSSGSPSVGPGSGNRLSVDAPASGTAGAGMPTGYPASEGFVSAPGGASAAAGEGAGRAATGGSSATGSRGAPSVSSASADRMSGSGVSSLRSGEGASARGDVSSVGSDEVAPNTRRVSETSGEGPAEESPFTKALKGVAAPGSSRVESWLDGQGAPESLQSSGPHVAASQGERPAALPGFEESRPPAVGRQDPTALGGPSEHASSPGQNVATGDGQGTGASPPSHGVGQQGHDGAQSVTPGRTDHGPDQSVVDAGPSSHQGTPAEPQAPGQHAPVEGAPQAPGQHAGTPVEAAPQRPHQDAPVEGAPQAPHQNAPVEAAPQGPGQHAPVEGGPQSARPVDGPARSAPQGAGHSGPDLGSRPVHDAPVADQPARPTDQGGGPARSVTDQPARSADQGGPAHTGTDQPGSPERGVPNQPSGSSDHTAPAGARTDQEAPGRPQAADRGVQPQAPDRGVQEPSSRSVDHVGSERPPSQGTHQEEGGVPVGLAGGAPAGPGARSAEPPARGAGSTTRDGGPEDATHANSDHEVRPYPGFGRSGGPSGSVEGSGGLSATRPSVRPAEGPAAPVGDRPVDGTQVPGPAPVRGASAGAGASRPVTESGAPRLSGDRPSVSAEGPTPGTTRTSAPETGAVDSAGQRGPAPETPATTNAPGGAAGARQSGDHEAAADGAATPRTTADNRPAGGAPHEASHERPQGASHESTDPVVDPLAESIARGERWRAFQTDRDERTARLLEFERDNNRARALDFGYQNFAHKDLFGGRGLPKDSVGYAQAERDFHTAVLERFKNEWNARGEGGLDRADWERSYQEIADRSDRYFATAAERHRELTIMDQELDRAVQAFRERDDLGDEDFLRESEDVSTNIEHYETEHFKDPTYDADNGRPRPGDDGYVPTSLSHLRADHFAKVRGIVDRAHEAFPDDVEARGRLIERQAGALVEDLPKRLASLWDATGEVEKINGLVDWRLAPENEIDDAYGAPTDIATRGVGHFADRDPVHGGERDGDGPQGTATGPDTASEGAPANPRRAEGEERQAPAEEPANLPTDKVSSILDEENQARMRQELNEDLHRYYQTGRARADVDGGIDPAALRRAATFGREWHEHVDMQMRALEARVGHAELRQITNARLQERLQEEFQKYEDDAFGFRDLPEDARERLSTELRGLNEKAVDEHFFQNTAGHGFRGPDFRGIKLDRWDGDASRPARPYDEHLAKINDTLEARFDHEVALREQLERAAEAYHPLRHDWEPERPLDEKVAEFTGDDYRAGTIEEYDRLFKPYEQEHNIKAWLEHEKAGGDAFGSTLESLPTPEQRPSGGADAGPANGDTPAPPREPEPGRTPAPESGAEGVDAPMSEGPQVAPAAGDRPTATGGGERSGQDAPEGGLQAQQLQERPAAPPRTTAVTHGESVRASRGPEEGQRPEPRPEQDTALEEAVAEQGSAPAPVQEQETVAAPQLSETERGIVERSGTSGTAEQRVKAWQEYRQASEDNPRKVQLFQEEVRRQGDAAAAWQRTRAAFLPHLAANELRDAEQKLQGFGVDPAQVTRQLEQAQEAAFEGLREPAPESEGAGPGIDALLEAPLQEEQAEHGYRPPTVEDVLEEGIPAPASPDTEVLLTDEPHPEQPAQAAQQRETLQPVETAQQQEPPSAARTETTAALSGMRTETGQRDAAYQEFEERLSAHPGLAGAPQVAGVREWYATARTSEEQGGVPGDLVEQLDTRLGDAQREHSAHAVAQKGFEQVASAVQQKTSLRGWWFRGTPQAQQLEADFTAAAVPLVTTAQGQQDAGTGPLDGLVEDFRARYEQAYQDWRTDEAAHAVFEAAIMPFGSDGASDIALGSRIGDHDAVAWYGDHVRPLKQDFVERWRAAGQDTAGRPTPDQAQAQGQRDAAHRPQGERDALRRDLRRNALDLMARARAGGRLDHGLQEIAERHTALPAWHPRTADWYQRERRGLLQEFTDGLRRQGPGAREVLASDFRRQLDAMYRAGAERDLAHQEFDRLAAAQEPSGTAPARPETRSWTAARTNELRRAYVQARLAEQAAAQAEAWRSEDTTGRRPELVPALSHVDADDWRQAAWQSEQIRLYRKYDTELGRAADEFAAEEASLAQVSAEHGTIGEPAPAENPYVPSEDEQHAVDTAFATWSQGEEGRQVPENLHDQVREGVLRDPAQEVFSEAGNAQNLLGRLADAFTREGVRQTVLDRGRQALDRIGASGHGAAQEPAVAAAADQVWPLLQQRLTAAVDEALPAGAGLRADPQETVRLGTRLWREAFGRAKSELAARVPFEEARLRLDERLADIAAQPQEHLDAGAHALFAAFEDTAPRNPEAGADAVRRPRFGAGDLQLSPQGWELLRSSAQSALDVAFRDTFDGVSPHDTRQTQTDRLGDWQQKADAVLGGLPERVAHQALRERLAQDALVRSGEALDAWQPQRSLGRDPVFGDLADAPLTADGRAGVQGSLVRDTLDLYNEHFPGDTVATEDLKDRMGPFHEALGKLTGQQELDHRILRVATWEAGREQGGRVFAEALDAWQADHPQHPLTPEQVARVRADHDARVRTAFGSLVGPALSRPQGLSAKSGPWRAELRDMASVLPDHFAFEVAEGAALRSAGGAFTTLHGGRPIAANRQEQMAGDFRDDWLTARKLGAPRTLSDSWGAKEAATSDAFGAGRMDARQELELLMPEVRKELARLGPGRAGIGRRGMRSRG